MWVMAGNVVSRQAVPHCLYKLAGVSLSKECWHETGLTTPWCIGSEMATRASELVPPSRRRAARQRNEQRVVVPVEQSVEAADMVRPVASVRPVVSESAGQRLLREDEASERREIIERRRMDRRRQIDPTTCERDYSDQQIEFMRAMDDYKRKSGRPFPTWSEVLEVLLSLGYRKVADPSLMEWKTLGDNTMSL